MTAKHRILMALINLYPVYLAANVRIRRPKGDPYAIESRMRLRFFNRNLFGTHFGGSLYAMCDPFFVFLLVEHLGDDFVVWDKAATIQFKKPGRGLVTAVFRVTPEQVAAVRDEVDANGKAQPAFTAEIRDEAGDVVAVLEKTLSVKRKQKAKEKAEEKAEEKAKDKARA